MQMFSARTLFITLVCIAGAAGCKTIPPDRYGIRRLNIEGTDQMDAEAIRACLASAERDRLGVDLGTSSDLTCGTAPFDGGRARLRFWPWPWAEWPTLDASIFERDLERIERWYRARGFYDARVLAAEFDPPAAADNDEIPETGEAPCEREGDDEGCAVDVTITIEEGEPVILRTLTIGPTPNLPAGIRRDIERAPVLEVGDRFDEALYDDSKRLILENLRDAGYACAQVNGRVTVDPVARAAVAFIDIDQGPIGRFASVEVVVSGDAEGIPLDTVRGAAGIDVGDRYSTLRITAAQRAVYGLGAFASVEVEATPQRVPGPGESADACGEAVDVVITVTPGRRLRYGVGFGLQTGEQHAAAGSATNLRQWDVHVQTFIEHRNFFGGLRRFRIEERPKVVFPAAFPRVRDDGDANDPDDNRTPTLGNELRLTFRQPAFIEERTNLEIATRWDYGPDPIYTDVIRHDLEASAIVTRPFWDGRVLASLGVHSQAYLPTCSVFNVGCDPANAQQPQPQYHLAFLSQSVRLDLRDDIRSTRSGAYFAIDLQEAGPNALSTYSYIRAVPEARFFIPLPLRSVFAMRLSVGIMHGIAFGGNAANETEVRSCALGPTRYRLRGGGPNSNRGFSPSALGDEDSELAPRVADDGFDPALPDRCSVPGGVNPVFEPIDGGVRRWEATFELRTRITESFGLVGFVDMGDVNREPRFRFGNLNTALGFGLRYYTIVGPVRADFAFLIPGLQHVGPGESYVRLPQFLGHNVYGTFTLTIGESF